MEKRVGSCKGCGQHCCTRLVVPLTEVAVAAYRRNEPVFLDFRQNDVECKWLEAHGLTMPFVLPRDAIVFQPRGLPSYLAMFPHRCAQLQEDGKCGLYGQPERPVICQEWPTASIHMQFMSAEGQAACGYSFQEV